MLDVQRHITKFFFDLTDGIEISRAIEGVSTQEKEFDEEWEIKQAKVWAQRLYKAFGDKLSSQPSVAALALQYYSQDLVPSLIGEWRREIKEFYEEEERAAAEGDF